MLAEGRAASALNHPNILRVYDADVDGTSYYLVSEWLEGKSLRDELARGPLPLKRLLDLSVQIADGLAAAHAIGIVHRDIKPENVMLAKDGTARIVDFGLSRSTPDGATLMTTDGHAATVSLEGGLSGTPAYMSPEQARGNVGDFRTDQFSFGALAYEMATGVHAFRRESVADTLAAVLAQEPRPIADLNTRIPAPIRWIVEQCLAKDANERYASTDDLARELRRVRDRLAEVLAEPKRRTKCHYRFSADGDSGGAGRRSDAWRRRVVTALARVPADPPLRFTPIATAAQYEGMPAWSADGQKLAYVADVDGVFQVFVRRLGDAIGQSSHAWTFDARRRFGRPTGSAIYSFAGRRARSAVGGRRRAAVPTSCSRMSRKPPSIVGRRLALLRAAVRDSLGRPVVVVPARREADSRNACALRPASAGRWPTSIQRRRATADLDVSTTREPSIGSPAIAPLLPGRIGPPPSSRWSDDIAESDAVRLDARQPPHRRGTSRRPRGNRHLWLVDTMSGTRGN